VLVIAWKKDRHAAPRRHRERAEDYFVLRRQTMKLLFAITAA
jgi:hypothetical protein